MISNGTRDFIVLLQVIAEQDKDNWPMMHGRCPDCRTPVSGRNPTELIGDLLGHQCLEHSETIKNAEA